MILKSSQRVRRAGQTDWPGLIVVLSIFAVLGGIMLIFRARSETKLAADAKEVPEEITLNKLIARGTSGNNNIILTNYVPCDNFVYQTKKGSWTCAWLPIVPIDSLAQGQTSGGKPSVIRAIIKSTEAKNANDLTQRCVKPRLRCMVINKISSLASDAQDLLESTYPGTDFSTCLIIEEGREPSSSWHIESMRLLGIALIPLGVIACFLAGYFKFSGSGGGGVRIRYRKVRTKKKRRDFEEEPSPRRRTDRSYDDEPRSRRRLEDDRESDSTRRRQRDDEDEDRGSRRIEGIDPETGRYRRRRRDDD